MKCWDGWSTSWTQDCQEKYQQSQICRWYHSNGRKWSGTKEPFMWLKEMNEKDSLKLNMKKKKPTKILASSPITSWQIWETVEAVTNFIFLGSRITADSDCSHEIKRCLLLGIKAMNNLYSILKTRDVTLLTKVCIVKNMVSQVVMYGLESWTIKKAESWRIDAFELWWIRLLRVPWPARSSN